MNDDFNLEDFMRVVELRRKHYGQTYAQAMAAIGAEIDDLAGSIYRGEPYAAMDALLDEISVNLTAYQS